MDTGIGREINVHGSQWDSLHGGYFGDAEVARGLVWQVKEAVEACGAEVVVDLAGGTGYLLSELVRGGLSGEVRLVNIDLSGEQLAGVKEQRVESFRGSIAEFRRGDIADASKRFLFMMRSALHYFGRDGSMSLLGHIRRQMRAGEFFVHQTACFESGRDACCLNMIYELMGTEKWYPTAEELAGYLEGAGFVIRSVSKAASLRLDSEELAKRYSLSEGDIERIGEKIIGSYGRTEDVVSIKPKGFCAYLHYRIYSCVAG